MKASIGNGNRVKSTRSYRGDRRSPSGKLELRDQDKVVLRGIKSEIIAGSVLAPKTLMDRAWNDANMRAGRIIDRYIAGEGLFQARAQNKKS